MAAGFVTFTDTPLTLTAGGERSLSRVQVAELGSYTDPRYGDFKITGKDAANWQRLLAEKFHGEIPIDTDHQTDKGVSSEASGWITGLTREGDKVYAEVEWNDRGREAIENRRYRYLSPTFVEDWADSKGKSHGPALLRAALTNNPFLRDMPPVSLSAHKPEGTVARRTGNGADSRAAMELTAIATALSLPADADEAKILEAITDQGKAIEKAKKRAAKPRDLKTLEADAAKIGAKVVKEKQIRMMAAQALEGAQAMAELRVAKFETAFTRALDEGRVDAKPETRDRLTKLYTLDADLTLEHLANLPAIAPVRPAGYGAHQTPGGGDPAPSNVDPDRHELHEQVQAYLAEHPDTGYVKALEAVTGTQLTGMAGN